MSPICWWDYVVCSLLPPGINFKTIILRTKQLKWVAQQWYIALPFSKVCHFAHTEKSLISLTILPALSVRWIGLTSLWGKSHFSVYPLTLKKPLSRNSKRVTLFLILMHVARGIWFPRFIAWKILNKGRNFWKQKSSEQQLYRYDKQTSQGKLHDAEQIGWISYLLKFAKPMHFVSYGGK